MNPSTKRIPWIDVAKGTTILLMIAGHSNLPMIIEHWIFAFHMPLFFILSGMTTNWARHGFLKFTYDKLKKLGLPFLLYSAICLVVIRSLGLADLSWIRGWGEFALWFVPVLFAALIIVKSLHHTSERIRLVALILLPLISVGLRHHSIALPWNMSVAPYAASFILLGSYAKVFISKIKLMSAWLVSTTLLTTVAISFFWHLDMAHNLCVPVIPITLGAITGSLFMFSVSMVIDKNGKTISRLCQIIGRETFVILAFSQIIIMTINRYWELCPIVKYLLLAIVLCIIIILKNRFVSYWNNLILK